MNTSTVRVSLMTSSDFISSAREPLIVTLATTGFSFLVGWSFADFSEPRT